MRPSLTRHTALTPRQVFHRNARQQPVPACTQAVRAQPEKQSRQRNQLNVLRWRDCFFRPSIELREYTHAQVGNACCGSFGSRLALLGKLSVLLRTFKMSRDVRDSEWENKSRALQSPRSGEAFGSGQIRRPKPRALR
jgi:hypothetical protein